ncbi:choice-of-anchor Q domain-containing protein [Massilia sp. R2A-15]|uniref:choice-of-anchor Q domain-containing protein n=1 Tax=Massilia sp. R2A-15 TaxID=3064278 RepID=UPI002735F811|nr:choice-of-anchor Q domain-containing protein [Massilia sp. R2A-15]WLI90662.1 choice-of-anchor Q domain-containing protein [Massilia sp. R2A-15]
MKKGFTFASQCRVHALLCCSAAVLLTACGGGASSAGTAQPTQAAAVSSTSPANQSGAPVASETTSAPVAPATSAPVASETTSAPVAPASSAPVAPASSAPVAPATSAPAASDTTSAPVAPATSAPVAPASSAPVAPASSAPVAPVQPAASSPTTTAAVAAACTYYIAPTGSDSGAGTLASPWKTVAYASAKLTAGKTLCARGGTYYGQAGLIWKSSGTAAAPVTFRNYPGETPVFDGQWGDTGTDGDFLVFSNNSHVVVDGITAQHFADQYGNGTIDLHNGVGPVDDITIQNSTLIDNGSHTAQDHHIYIATGVTNVTIRNNRFIRAAGSAIQAYHSPASSGIKVYNNVMIGGTLKCSQSKSNPCSASATQHWGLIIGDAKDTQIYNNTIYGMQYGMDFNYGTTSTGPYVVKNNLIVNSTVAAIRVDSAYAPYFTSDYNGFSGNANDINWKGSNMTAAQFAVSTTNERHAVSGNPMFVNAAAGDFHLNAGSPMINKALSMNLFSTDMDWLARPSGAFDIGAYEKQ